MILARARQVQALERAREHLGVAAAHAEQRDAVLDLFAEELRLAGNALAEVTGEFTADDLLGVIFSRFCIGKFGEELEPALPVAARRTSFSSS